MILLVVILLDQMHPTMNLAFPSLSSMMFGLWVIYSDSADPRVLGETWARKFARGMNHTMDVREQMGGERFLDLWFKDTVRQPLVEIQKIYDFVGMDFTDEARAEMEQWQDFNKRELRPAHEYKLEEFGFTEADLKQQFARYRTRFIQ